MDLSFRIFVFAVHDFERREEKNIKRSRRCVGTNVEFYISYVFEALERKLLIVDDLIGS